MTVYANNGWAPDSMADDGAGLWPPGNYTGTLLRHECGATLTSGTNYIRLWFEVNGAQKEVTLYLTDRTETFVKDKLDKLGWNYDPVNMEFANATDVPLYMKHETYKGRARERWDISTFESRPADGSLMARFAARCRAKGRPAPSVPSAPPSVPSRAGAAAGAVPPRPSAPPRRPEAALTNESYTQESAWAAWVEELGDKCDAGAFWAAVDRVRGEREVEQMTAKDWADVVAACPPF